MGSIPESQVMPSKVTGAQRTGQCNYRVLIYFIRRGWVRGTASVLINNGTVNRHARTKKTIRNEKLRPHRASARQSHGMKEQFRRLNAKLRGYHNYYGVNGNYASLNEFFHQLQRLHLKWLNRRSQRPSYTWDSYHALTQHFALARPRIVGRPKSCLVAARP